MAKYSFLEGNDYTSCVFGLFSKNITSSNNHSMITFMKIMTPIINYIYVYYQNDNEND